jgi:hypothetical protein
MLGDEASTTSARSRAAASIRVAAIACSRRARSGSRLVCGLKVCVRRIRYASRASLAAAEPFA